MKVLTLVGVKPDDADWQLASRPLAYVYFTRWPFLFKRLVVKPAGNEYKAFAQEVERLITKQLEEHPDKAFFYPDPDPESDPHANKIAKADDPNLLEAIQHDLFLWGRAGGKPVAGYYVLPTFSKVEEG